MSVIRQAVVVLAVGTMVGAAACQEPTAPPAGPPEQLPTPTPIPAPVVVERVGIPAFPLGSRDVWSNFAVDSSGRFRPRVVLAPYDSSYYLYNGAPYRYLPTRNLSYKPRFTN